eukprot:m.143960 g.143960  ORF g.143960 m.143960 type:complete len:258 (-) comp16754_c2_seq2:1351-2124(-)
MPAKRLSPSLLLALVVVVCAAATGVAAEGNVIDLTEENFEHLTQASTGATTGNWFVKFYAPWCGHCKHLAPVWEELATSVKGEVNVAKVDCTKQAGLCSRFSLQGYPTLRMFSLGRMYDYKGGRSLEDLSKYALGDFKTESSVEVPLSPPFFSVLLSKFENYVNNIHWHSDPLVNAGLIGFALAGALIVPFALIAVILAFVWPVSPDPAADKEAMEKLQQAVAAAAKDVGATIEKPSSTGAKAAEASAAAAETKKGK